MELITSAARPSLELVEERNNCAAKLDAVTKERDKWHEKYKAVTQAQGSAFKAWLTNRDQLLAEIADLKKGGAIL